MESPMLELGAILGVVFLTGSIVLLIVAIAGMWKTFHKADLPGWAVLVPIYNWYLMLQISKMPVWWLVVFCIPGVGLVPHFLTSLKIAQGFGKTGAFGVGVALLPFIFFVILGFGSANYEADRIDSIH